MSLSASAPAVVANLHCLLGENPLWDERAGVLYWEDILGGRLHAHTPATGRTETLYTGPVVGGFTQEEDGSLVLFRERDVAVRRPDGAVRVLRAFHEPGQTRFNDVIADPRGRVFAGTIGETGVSGGVWRFDPDGSARRVITGTGCSNGMGFSADRARFYWTCSTRRQIYEFPYDAATGALGPAALWHQAADGEGTPDGLALDTRDHVWSARWDGHALREHAPDGRVVGEIKFPVAQVSSVCFGGDDLGTMFVTTAGGNGVNSPEGALFAVRRSGVRGKIKFRSRLL